VKKIWKNFFLDFENYIYFFVFFFDFFDFLLEIFKKNVKKSFLNFFIEKLFLKKFEGEIFVRSALGPDRRVYLGVLGW